MQETLLYRVLARLLIVGVAISLLLMGIGYVLLAARHATGRDTWLPLGSIIPRALAGDPGGILDLGILVLFATPTLRVAAAIGLFAAERQPRYTLISAVVLILLALSVTVAAHT